ncbi:MAG: filamentous hemagglutinin N-terminal domain-containing protein, partial [Gammaproteobacteria bacterium]|nr:filamentous hemagglutinin N-terminal domain-containing protein [Gammaproteobacteria bacterium]
MNKIYKVIYSKTLGCLVVVSESAKYAGGKKTARRKLVSLVAASSLLSMPVFADNLPTGGQVVSGAASISSNGSAMTVNQSTDKMIANWQSFSVGAGNSVTFNQPSVSSVALNRVVGHDASQILGNLNSNGQVFLINPNGVAVGASGSVQTGGFIASTLDITNENFLSGKYQFTGIGGSISNKGNITGRIVALIAPSVTNEGSINSNSINNTSSDSVSSVALAAGTDVLLDFDGDGLLSVEVKANTLAGLVENKGLIQTDGGVAILTAKGASDVLKGVVNNSGMIQANTLASQNGRILLLGDMSNGEVIASGSLEANFVETSAATVKIDKDLKVATNGGEWLIDPVNITVDSAMATATQNSLTTGDVTITTAGAGSDEGNITVDASINWSTNTLTLRADNDIIVNAELTSTGTTSSDGLVLQYAQTTSTGDYSINAPVNLATGSLFQTKKGSDAAITYTVITSLGSEGSTTGTDLQGINGGLNGNYVLGANIDASSVSTWNSNAGFDPLGDGTNNFTGLFDGLGHTISNLFIDRDTTGFVGLFAGAENSTIRNVGLLGADITGHTNVGSLAGYLSNTTKVSNSYATGSINGYSVVGGLAGYNRGNITNTYSTANATATNGVAGGFIGRNDGTISNAYATGNVSGNSAVGGFFGTSSIGGSVSNSYATGKITGDGNNVGGFAGRMEGSISNVYWDIDGTGQTDAVGYGISSGITGVYSSTNTIDAFSEAIYAGFDFTNGWYMIEGSTRPFLRSEYSTTISNDHQLQLMAMDLTASYTLANDIIYSGDMWSSSGFSSIGSQSTRFRGNFDGVGHTISDLFINRDNTDFIGLFGFLDSSSTIKNIGLINADITGKDYIGGLVGWNYGAINNSFTTGKIMGNDSVGGLIGSSENNITIKDSYSFASVDGNDYIGGLVGYNARGIENSYATGTVNGNNYVGGLVGSSGSSSSQIINSYATGQVTTINDYAGGLAGSSAGSITNSYATGSVNSGRYYVGGLVAANSGGTITNSYWDIDTTGRTIGVGQDSGTITNLKGVYSSTGTIDAFIQDTYTGFDFTNDWILYEGYTRPLLRNFMTTLTVTANDATKTYDGSAYSGANGVTYSTTPNSNLLGTVNYSGTSQGANNTGTYTLTPSGLYSNQQGYIISYVDGSLTIDPKVITATYTADNKVYDGNTDVTVNGSLSGIISGDDVSFSQTAEFDNKNAGENKTVTVSGLTLSGDDAANYSLASTTAVTTADIAKAVISAITGITADDKTYDGNTTATLDTSGTGFTGMVSGDDLMVASASGAFADKNAGTNKTVTVSGLSLSGTDAGNYNLSNTTTVTTADIAKAVISAITGITANNKTYDGNTTATLDTSGTGFTGMVSGDDLTVASA